MIFVSGLLAVTGIFCIVGAFIYRHKGHDIGLSYLIGAVLTLMGIISLAFIYIFDERMSLRFWGLCFGIIFEGIALILAWGPLHHKEKWNSSPIAPFLMGLFSFIGAFVI